MGFRRSQKVMFKHCDPAGIVFYPRYFEMMNDCVEAFFDALGHRFEEIHKAAATPTVRIETEFMRPSRHGDPLEFILQGHRLGRSSFDFTISTRCGEELRMTFKATLVYVDGSGKPSPWPQDIRRSLQDHMESEA